MSEFNAFSKSELLTSIIPKALNYIPSTKDGGQELRESIFKEFGVLILGELEGEKSLREYHLRLISEFLLWQGRFDSNTLDRWLNRSDFKEPPNARFASNVSELRRKLFENENEEFIRVVEEDEEEFDAKWNNLAMEYIDLIRETDNTLATTLNDRISRDVDAEILQLIESAVDFQMAIDDVERYLLSTSNDDWEWGASHLYALIRKTPISLEDDPPRFPANSSSELFSDRGLVGPILFGEDDITPNSDQLNNLSRIISTRSLLITILDSDADWSNITTILNKWANRTIANIFAIVQQRWLDAKTRQDKDTLRRVIIPQMETLEVASKGSPKELSLVLLIILSRMGGRVSVDQTAGTLGLPVSGTIPDLLVSIRQKYAEYDPEVKFSNPSTGEVETTLSDVIIEIFNVYNPYK